MAAAWAICVPVGLAFLRRFKTEGTAADLKVHIALMSAACALTILGVALAFAWASSQPSDRVTATVTDVHVVSGIVVTLLVVVQVGWASQRPSPPGEGEGEKSPARARWENAHRATFAVMFLLALFVQGITGPLSLGEQRMETMPP